MEESSVEYNYCFFLNIPYLIIGAYYVTGNIIQSNLYINCYSF